MQDAEAIHEFSRIAGIVQEIEADPQIAEILAPKDSAAIAFRQLVGYQVLIAMNETACGKEITLKGSPRGRLQAFSRSLNAIRERK